ncbi:kda protein in nof-fb transposable element [Lasius niger]|uniref:KDa protein in nof-fb transposable element n=1 Tax=Lasius niger TaxID=67767 RepID=A0A0J7MQL2_LASNI|nr:kda protein in nof-fb transposable element [Lasius niger]
MGVFVPSKLDHNNNSSIDSSMNTVQFDSDESYTDLSSEENQFLDTFDLVLTDEQWNAIKPDIECNSRAKLKPGIWTNEIAISFFKQYRLPCAFVFK